MSTTASLSAVSSSSTLWATPSKEWVIPAKPKPGRKPKKDPAPPATPVEDADADAKGRRVQNRAAQRAFRERKQSQLAELQAKVQQYEQGQIERNVALQNIAKRLKEENEKLRKETALLQEKLAAVEQERDSLRDSNRKRRFEDTPSQSMTDIGVVGPLPKRPRVSMDPFEVMSHTPTTPSPYTSSPSSLASSPASMEHSSFSPMPSLPPARDLPVFAQGNSLTSIFDFISSGKTSMFETNPSLDTFDCGLCTDNTPCVCRELALQAAGERFIAPLATMKVEHTEVQALETQLTSQASQPSILDNLPAYQPPVPLRRRNIEKPASNPIFPVSPLPSDSAPGCTGDPSNCPACADDAFGKAFCAAISKSVSSTSPCSDCPSRNGGGGCGSTSGSGCCGNPGSCGRSRESGVSTSSVTGPSHTPPSDSTSAATTTISCDDAWRQIKSHPNVAFADLDLLADVVARRSKCTGPRVEIFPAPGSITPERGLSPPTVPATVSGQLGSVQSMTDVSAAAYSGAHRDHGRGSPSLQLVPQEVLVQCGKQRVREVNADGVRDALRLLDLKFALS